MTGPRKTEQEAFDAARDRVAEQERDDLLDGYGEDGPSDAYTGEPSVSVPLAVENETIDVSESETIGVSAPGCEKRAYIDAYTRGVGRRP